MAGFVDVYIEGTDDTSAAALKRAVTSLARCLAIPELRAHALLGQGRVKVRSNLAPELANELIRLLEKAGVRATTSPATTTAPGLPRKDERPGGVSSTGERPQAGAPPRLGTGPARTLQQDEEAITGVFETVPDPTRQPTPQPPGLTPPPDADERTDPRGRPR